MPVVPMPVERHEEPVVSASASRSVNRPADRERVRREDAKLEQGTYRDLNGEIRTDPNTVIRVPAPKAPTEVRIRFQDLGDGYALVDLRDFAAIARTTAPLGNNPHPAR